MLNTTKLFPQGIATEWCWHLSLNSTKEAK